MKNKGISLLMLVVTMVAMVILSGIVIVNVIDNNPMSKGIEAVFKNNLNSFASELSISSTNYLYQNGFDINNKVIINVYEDFDTLKYYIPSLTEKWEDKIGILESELIFCGKNPKEIKWAKEIGIGIDGIDTYYTELRNVEKAVKKARFPYPGTNTSENPISIRGIKYEGDWYKIETEEDFKNLKMDFTEIRYAPYLVRYSDGAVVNIEGRLINNSPVHSLNYLPIGNSLVLDGMLTATDKNSIANQSNWGQLEITASTGNENVSYTNGGINLTEKSRIPVLKVDQTRPINEKYSVNVTVKGKTTNQITPEGFPATILAISDVIQQYLCWIGIQKGFLYVYTFRERPHFNLTAETEEEGFVAVNIKEYENKVLNLQLTATRNGKSILYINGKKIKEFTSGSGKYSYRTLTLGDLRVGRGLKYNGTIYNFSLYSNILTQEQITQNFNYIKKEVGI